MKKTIIIAFSLMLIIILTSCNTYDYGPQFSLRTAESRLTGEWELKATLIDDRNNPLIFEQEKNYIIKFKDSGDAYKTKTIDGNCISITNGSWNFADDKKLLIIQWETDDITAKNEDRLKILKLTNSNLWTIDFYDYPQKSNMSKVERRFIKIQ